MFKESNKEYSLLQIYNNKEFVLVSAALQCWEKCEFTSAQLIHSALTWYFKNWTQLFIIKIILSKNTGWTPTDLLQQLADAVSRQCWHLGEIQAFFRGQTASLLDENMNINLPPMATKRAPVLRHLLRDLPMVLQVRLVADQPRESGSWGGNLLQLLEAQLRPAECFLWEGRWEVRVHSWVQCRPAASSSAPSPAGWCRRAAGQRGLPCSKVGACSGTSPGRQCPISQSESTRPSDASPGSCKHLSRAERVLTELERTIYSPGNTGPEVCFTPANVKAFLMLL